MAKDITLLEEISDLDLDQVNGSGHGWRRLQRRRWQLLR